MLSSDHARIRAEALGHEALTDPLTGLANRIHFELVYNYVFEAGDRGLAFTLMLISSGASDEAGIASVGGSLDRTTRNSDLVAHVGGGRYVALLLGTNLSGARIAADRLERALAGAGAEGVSFGLAGYTADASESGRLLVDAERALRAAESRGGGVELA